MIAHSADRDRSSERSDAARLSPLSDLLARRSSPRWGDIWVAAPCSIAAPGASYAMAPDGPEVSGPFPRP
jgi:hypothetical protein